MAVCSLHDVHHMRQVCVGADQVSESHLVLLASHKLVRAARQLGPAVRVSSPAIWPHVLDVVVRRLSHGVAERAGEFAAALQPDHVRVHVGLALAAAHWTVRPRVNHLEQQRQSERTLAACTRRMSGRML